MRIIRSLLLCHCLLISSAGFLAADDSTFLSLTRTSRPVREMPSNVSQMTGEEIQATGAKTVAELLDFMPAVVLSRSGGLGRFASVRVRGVPSSSQVQVVVDDRPLGGVSNQFIDLSLIPVENIDRIELVRGGSSVLYGANTIGGVVHIITKSRREHGWDAEVGLETRSHQTRIVRGTAGAAAGLVDGFVTLNRYRTDGFQQNSDAENVSGSANVGLSFDNGSRLSADFLRTMHRVGNPQGTSVPISEWDGKKERIAANPDGRVEQDKSEGRLKYSASLPEAGVVEFVGYAIDHDYATLPRLGADPDFEQVNKIVGGDARFMGVGGLTVGAAYERDEQETRGSAANHITNQAVYLQKEWMSRRWYMVPAVRYDHNSEFGGVTNPRLTTVVHLTDRWNISANAARSFRAPSFLELFYSSMYFNGNRNLDPEIAWTYDLGTSLDVLKRSRVSVTGYYTRIKDRIAATATTYENLPKAELSGTEVELQSEGKAWSGRANYTFQRAIGNAAGSSAYVPLRLTPRHRVAALVTWKPGGAVHLTNGVRYVSKQFQYNNRQGETLPPYFLWDIRLSKNFSHFDIFAGVDNVTDRHYAESFDVDPATFGTTLNPQPARTYYAGGSVRLGGH